jgi:phosphoserine phosphatase
VSVARFAAVILDVDSTLSGIEGIDWLAERRGAAVAAEVARLTERAMDGAIRLDEVYALRLELVHPSRIDCEQLAIAYQAAIAPGAAETIAKLQTAGVRIHVVSGGIRNAIIPFAHALNVQAGDVHAVELTFDKTGAYTDFNRTSPLATQTGKALVASSLAAQRPVLAVGDGATDAAMKPAVDAFGAFVGFVRRDPVVQQANLVFNTFDDILNAVLP